MSQFALEISDLQKTYDSGVVALKGINLAIENMSPRDLKPQG